VVGPFVALERGELSRCFVDVLRWVEDHAPASAAAEAAPVASEMETYSEMIRRYQENKRISRSSNPDLDRRGKSPNHPKHAKMIDPPAWLVAGATTDTAGSNTFNPYAYFFNAIDSMTRASDAGRSVALKAAGSLLKEMRNLVVEATTLQRKGFGLRRRIVGIVDAVMRGGGTLRRELNRNNKSPAPTNSRGATAPFGFSRFSAGAGHRLSHWSGLTGGMSWASGRMVMSPAPLRFSGSSKTRATCTTK